MEAETEREIHNTCTSQVKTISICGCGQSDAEDALIDQSG